MNIGFIGAGIMGHGMVLNLLGAGHDVSVIAHRNRAPIDDLVSKGAHEAPSMAQLAAGKDALVLCVTGTPAARSVVNGLAPHLQAGTLVIDTTTNAPDGPAQLADIVDATGAHYVEAPVTGGVQQARDGVLGAIVGCDDALVEPATAVLSGFCKRIEHFGPVGMGAKTKLVSNFLALGTATLVIEAFRLARTQGVDWQKLYDLAQLGSGNSSGCTASSATPSMATSAATCSRWKIR